MSESYDFDAMIEEIGAQDGERKRIRFQKGGEEFVVPAPIDWPDSVLEKGSVASPRPKPMYRPAVSYRRNDKSQEQREREWAERAAAREREVAASGD